MTDGGADHCGFLQSTPSMSMESCAPVSRIQALDSLLGQKNFPRSKRLLNRQ